MEQKKKLFLVVFFTYFTSLLVYLPSFWQYEDEQFPCAQALNTSKLEKNNTICHFYQPRSGQPLWAVYTTLQLVVMKLIPTISVVIMNVFLISKLQKLNRKSRGRISESSLSISEASKIEENPIKMNTLSFNIYKREETEKQIRAKIKMKLKQMMKEARRLRVLISILTSYAIFTLPNTITMSCWLFGAILDLWQQDGITFRILTGTSSLLLSFKYSLNFYLYCIANSYIFE